jgi:hypothetical protein
MRNRRGNNATPNDHPEALEAVANRLRPLPHRRQSRCRASDIPQSGDAVPQRTATLGMQSGAKVCLTRFDGHEGRSRVRQMRRLRSDDAILLSRGARGSAGRRVPPAEWLQSPHELPGGIGLPGVTGAAVRSRGIGQTTYWGLPGPITTVGRTPRVASIGPDRRGAKIRPAWGLRPIPEPGAR